MTMPTANPTVDHAALEFKRDSWEVKAIDDAGQIEIYVAHFNNIDRGGDVIEPGAFKNVDEFVRSGWLGTNHQMDLLPCGFPVSAVQDSKGLLCKFQFHSTPEGQACRTVVKERLNAQKSVAGSIGYKVRPGGAHVEYKDGRSVRMLTDVDLWEASVVNLPMNPRAEALSAKSLEATPVDADANAKVMTVDDLKSWLEEQTKAGRVLSKANHATIKEWHGTLSKMCADMKSLVDQYDPDARSGDDEGEKEVIARNTSGNSLPATRNPRGAVTAADIPGKSLEEWRKQREEQLHTLRARVQQDMIRFSRCS